MGSKKIDDKDQPWISNYPPLSAFLHEHMVIQENAEGRPCAWGVASSEGAARQEAERQWDLHVERRRSLGDPTETKGAVTTHVIEAPPTAP